MTMVSFLEDCRHGNVSQSLCHFQLDHHRGRILVPLPTGGLEDVEVLRLYDVVSLAGIIRCCLCWLFSVPRRSSGRSMVVTIHPFFVASL